VDAVSMQKSIEAIRRDSALSEQERIWTALRLIAKRLDTDDEDGILGAIFGAD
jgi:hypothetical protein